MKVSPKTISIWIIRVVVASLLVSAVLAQDQAFPDTDTQAYTPQDFRFTSKGGAIDSIELGLPAAYQVVIHSLASAAAEKVVSVTLLSTAAPVEFKQQPDALRIQIPEHAPGQYVDAFRIAVAKGT